MTFPLATIFAVLVGAKIGGIVGIYLAVPLMASMRVISHEGLSLPARRRCGSAIQDRRDGAPLSWVTRGLCLSSLPKCLWI
jgi:hypothetical protein